MNTSPDEADDGPRSSCHVSLLEGPPISVWVCPKTAVASDTIVRELPGLALSLAPDRLVVVGRSSGTHAVPYLDPAYRATPVVPDTGQSVLRGDGERDNRVSRAHFTLRGAAGGIVFTNGVPRLGGGIRPPLNGTWLLAPAVRFLDDGEEVLIERGGSMTLRLPNHCVLRLAAQ